ncbi:MAG: hypothetical protein GC136_07555 [Alphaproteobacteria bacterium]|nr:hypothetical protein [Alphaproteobacteria bacterium]
MTQHDEFDDPRNEQAEALRTHVSTRMSSQMRMIGQFVGLVLGIAVLLGGAVWGINTFVLNQFEPQNTPVVPAEEDTAFKTAPEGEEAPADGNLVPGSDSAIFDSFKTDAEKTADATGENVVDDTSAAEAVEPVAASDSATPSESLAETTPAEEPKTENLFAETEAAKPDTTESADAAAPTDITTDITESKTAPSADDSAEEKTALAETEVPTTDVAEAPVEEVKAAEEAPAEEKVETKKEEKPATTQMKSSLGPQIKKLEEPKPAQIGNNNSVYKSVYDEPYSPNKVYPPVAKTTGTTQQAPATSASMADKLLSQPAAAPNQPIVASRVQPATTASTNEDPERTAGAGVPSYDKLPNVLGRSKVSAEEALNSDLKGPNPAPSVGMKPIVENAPVELATPSAANPASGTYVQLGSVRTQADAQAQWEKIRKANGDLLSSLSPRFIPATVDGQGQFVRIQAGPLAEAQASSLCSSMNSKSSGSCLVVR